MASPALHAELDFSSVDALREHMLAQIARTPEGFPLSLHLDGAGAIDTAGLQLLLAFWHAAAERGSAVVLHDAPPALLRCLAMVNLADRFTLA